jgi:hypothetical protein
MTFPLACLLGIAFLPTYVAAYYDGLVMVGEQPIASPVLYLAHDKSLTRIARSAEVIDWLKEIFDARRQPWFQQDFVHPREFAMRGDAGRLSVDPPQ